MAISRVFIVQQPVIRDAQGRERPMHDYTAAAKFGQIITLAPNNKMILTPDVFRDFLRGRLNQQKFDANSDYVIATGDYTVLIFVGMILANDFGRVKVLRWVPQEKAYQPIQLDL